MKKYLLLTLRIVFGLAGIYIVFVAWVVAPALARVYREFAVELPWYSPATVLGKIAFSFIGLMLVVVSVWPLLKRKLSS